MNHDCRPKCVDTLVPLDLCREDELMRISAGYYFDKATFTHKVHAVREITLGEEITISCN